MSNHWEDWDFISNNFEISLINIKELKQLEERKLIEESDIQLTKELFFIENEIIHIKKEKRGEKN